MTWPLVAIIGASAIVYLMIKSRQQERDLARWIRDRKTYNANKPLSRLKTI